MGKLVYSMMVSLDGYIARPDGALDWVLIDEELHAFANDQARAEGAFLYGRRLYETMAAYWPTADADPSAHAVEIDFARIWRDKPKLVFSRTLDSVAWNSRLVREVSADEIRRLKAESDKNLSVGGADLAASFVRLGLIDEYQPIVQPVILGNGIPFLPRVDHALKLRLVETRRFQSGVVFLRYQTDN
ncbi:MAG: dihydrofolate reductase family protein [Anaerolineae bacterium]